MTNPCRVQKRWYLLGVFVLGGLLAWTAFIYIGNADSESYQKAVLRANARASWDSTQVATATQERVGVRREIWYNKGNGRLKAVLTCPRSELVIERADGKQEIVEKMEAPYCRFQENLEFGLEANSIMQKVRTVEAKRAAYRHAQNHFSGQDVRMALYEIPGDDPDAELDILAPSETAEADVVDIFFARPKQLQVSLVGNVALHAGDGKHLFCHYAELDESGGDARFCSQGAEDKVIYQDDGRLCEIRADRMTVRYGPPAEADAPSGVEMREVSADNDVVMAMEGIGQARTEGTVVIAGPFRKEIPFHTLRCTGKTVLQCDNEDKDLNLVLECPGQLEIDLPGRRAVLKCAHKSGEQIEEAEQVFFQDHLGKVYSDEAVINFDWVDGTPHIRTIALQGHVKMIHRQGALMQYALADTVDIDYPVQEMFLRAFPEKRILLYDKINNLEVSAPALKVKRDITTGKHSYQGTGQVTFRFAEEEFRQMKKRFQLEKNK